MELTPRRIDASFFAERDDTVVTWLGMAGVLINSRGTVALIDPLIAVSEKGGIQYSETGLRMKVRVPIAAEEVPRADLVMYTHAEDDHCGAETASILERKLRPTFLSPPPVFQRLAPIGIDPSCRIVARDFGTFRKGAVEVTVTPALHDHDPVNPWKHGDCVGYLVRTPDGSLWHPGDTRLIPELLDVRDVDVLMWDVSVSVDAHLCPDGSAAIARTCGARVLFAYHYGTMIAPERGAYARALESEPEDSKPFLKGLDGKFLVMSPGEILRLPA